MLLDLPAFIQTHVTGRAQSLFSTDIEANEKQLNEAIQGKNILVIGGAGTIGSAFIQALLPFRPQALWVIDQHENGLAELVRDVRSQRSDWIPKVFRTYAFDYGEPMFHRWLRQAGAFDIVLNFAAHKHVRSEKDGWSTAAMINNNILKTWQLLNHLTANPPARFFCVSTDKASNPVNVMGASKKWMEDVLMAFNDTFPVVTARFANVAFSNGSLLDGFLHRMARKQPLSAPHDIERYFLSAEEAGQLCLMAAVLAPHGSILIPRLGEHHEAKKFSAIGTQLIEAFGYEPVVCLDEATARQKVKDIANGKWPIHLFESDTSGEKAIESFFIPSEKPDFSLFHAIGIIRPQSNISLIDCAERMAELEAVLQGNPPEKFALIKLLQHLVPDFQHLETGKNLDERM